MLSRYLQSSAAAILFATRHKMAARDLTFIGVREYGLLNYMHVDNIYKLLNQSTIGFAIC